MVETGSTGLHKLHAIIILFICRGLPGKSGLESFTLKEEPYSFIMSKRFISFLFLYAESSDGGFFHYFRAKSTISRNWEISLAWEILIV